MKEAVPKRRLLVIVGPTAAGKTALSLALAGRFDGEILSADSRLFYRGMNIGVAKPSRVERQMVPHHLIDIAQPDEPVTLGAYQKLAYATIDAVHRRRRLPLLVGGAGQYVWAIVEGWGIPRVAPQPRLRRALEAYEGAELARWLELLDPVAAARLDARNRRRVIRALEVTLVSGRPISALQQKTPPPYEVTIVGLAHERHALYERIDRRVDQMMAQGLLKEVRALWDAGYERNLPALSGLGYRQLWSYLEGECTLEEAIERIKFETHRFVRQQATWFRRDDPRIRWFDAGQPALLAMVAAFVAARLS